MVCVCAIGLYMMSIFLYIMWNFCCNCKQCSLIQKILWVYPFIEIGKYYIQTHIWHPCQQGIFETPLLNLWEIGSIST